MRHVIGDRSAPRGAAQGTLAGCGCSAKSNPAPPSGIGVGTSACPSCPVGTPLWHRASSSWRCGVVTPNQPHGSGGGVATPGRVCASDEVWAKTAQGGPYFCGVPCNNARRQQIRGGMNMRARGGTSQGWINKETFTLPDGTWCVQRRDGSWHCT